MGDTNKKPLVEMDDKTITIGEREESIEYLKELKAINQPLITNKPLQQGWKGPNAICWCDNFLKTEMDICKKCRQKA